MLVVLYFFIVVMICKMICSGVRFESKICTGQESRRFFFSKIVSLPYSTIFMVFMN
jgi:hypothetical protein